MKRLRNRHSMLAIIAALVVSPLTPQTAAADNHEGPSDLVLLENVPQVEAEFTKGELDLTALNLYEDGHFTEADEDLSWSSSNKNVATVDDEGTVTLSGKNGRTFISVTDGTHKDRIAVDHKPASSQEGKPDVEGELVKQEGDRYEVIDQAIDGMTIHEKVGQMLMPDFRNWDGENVTEMLPEIEQTVKDYHLGGVILFRENVVTTEQTAELVADYQEASEKYGLLMTIDQEGGIVTRLQSGTDMPGNMALGATRSLEITEDVGHAIGSELESLGINMNLAPVLDVNNNPDNPVIGTRSFGEDPDLVADLGIAYTKGLQSTGVAATAKHFPGHGDTAVDSHLGLPEVPHDKERLMDVELHPFQQAMEADIDAIMTAHVTFPKIDDTKVTSQKDGTEISLPATLSPKVLTGLMREEMGYEGLIITDALNMKAISDHFGSVDAVIRSVKAGTDIVLMPVGLEEVADGLLEAVETDEISEERIEESVERILTLKLKRGIIKAESAPDMDEIIANAEETVGSEEHQAVEEEASNQSITLLKNDNVLPLDADRDEKVVVIGNTFIDRLYDSVSKHNQNTDLVKASGPLSDEQLAQMEEADHIIIGTYTFNVAGRDANSLQMQLANQLINEVDTPVIGVGIRNPYDVMAYPDVDGYLAQYGFNDVSFDATASTLFGENNPSGTLPVTIPGKNGNALYEFGHGLNY
ncbi:beta-hexosaminidase [Halobacillus andaensis]|uniref:beta-N-acetylhexosaminidase n=1 Tax=Halobacillus andaensis TaxID=1176239 RepID=A0A917BCG3_HALAA|nr:glycoside hydrolase family 3 protein [Halobacillus andaensis]MBP2006641.1 beta-N-acetylhexosaminidase [Halobacillus andaensis]GGF34963.1 beta-hexosaminidase [Halobacillus andaensis]